MTTFHGSVTDEIAADPDLLFGLITDIDRLPEWNSHIHHVVEAPAELETGSEWVVEMRAMGAKWDSRTCLEERDPEARYFSYVSRSDDGNPSRALWSWQLTPTATGTRVAVEWELRPKTFWRKRLFARIRHRQLQHEVRASLHAAEAAVPSRQARA